MFDLVSLSPSKNQDKSNALIKQGSLKKSSPSTAQKLAAIKQFCSVTVENSTAVNN